MDVSKIEIKKLEFHQREEISMFLQFAGSSLKHFRYFQSRPLEVLENHLVTVHAYFEGLPIGYGHLDLENGLTWLGIAVSEKFKGKRIGLLIMNELISYAEKNKVKEINLSVDNDNKAARKLYEKLGFKITKEGANSSFYMLKLNSLNTKESNAELIVSTMAFSGKSVEEIVEEAAKQNFALEFSSGMPYKENMIDIFLNAPVKKYIHNYFPAPKEPFVLNLASRNSEIRTQSISHCVKGLELAKQVDCKFYSVHAGFCIDPDHRELGKLFKEKTEVNKEENIKLFKDSLTKLLVRAEDLNVDLYIENNVAIKENLEYHGQNPFLCVDPDEIIRIIRDINHPRLKLLLDTAHLKVSSCTLKFDLDEAVNKLAKYVGALHHSDNQGLKDTNNQLSDNYWFNKHFSMFSHKPHVLEVKNLRTPEIKQNLELINEGIAGRIEKLLTQH